MGGYSASPDGGEWSFGGQSGNTATGENNAGYADAVAAANGGTSSGSSNNSVAYTGTMSASAGGGYADGYNGQGATPAQAASAAATAAEAGNYSLAASITASTNPAASAAYAAQAAQNASYSSASQAVGGGAQNLNPVGTPAWWSYELASREAAAKSNTAANPVSKSTPGYYEYYAPTYIVGTPEWYGQIAEAKQNEPLGAVAQTQITPATPGYFQNIYPTLQPGSSEYWAATTYGYVHGITGAPTASDISYTTPGYFQNIYPLLSPTSNLYYEVSAYGKAINAIDPQHNPSLYAPSFGSTLAGQIETQYGLDLNPHQEFLINYTSLIAQEEAATYFSNNKSLPGPYGTSVTSLSKIGSVPTLNGEIIKTAPAPMVFEDLAFKSFRESIYDPWMEGEKQKEANIVSSPQYKFYQELISTPFKITPGQKEAVSLTTAVMFVPTALFELGKSYQEGVVSPVSTGAYGMIANSPLPSNWVPAKEVLNFGVGFGEMTASIPTALLSLPYAVAYIGTKPAESPLKGVEIGSGMLTSMLEREKTNPGSFAGSVTGMVYGPKVVGELLPIGVDLAEIPSSSGAKSTVVFAYTKMPFTSMDAATIRATYSYGALSEPAKIVASPSFALKPGEINVLEGRVPSFTDVATARTSLDALAGKEGTFLHGTNDVRFVQSLIENGKVLIGAGEKGTQPLYLAAKENTVYTRFIKGASEVQPGSSAIVRVSAIPKTVEEALQYKGSIQAPELKPGLYPGTKPITGEGWKGQLQSEMIIPAGSKLSVTDVSFLERDGVKVPVIDVVIGNAGIIDRFNMGVNKFEYNLNAARLGEFGRGNPIDFLSRQSIAMSNPLEEVASKQWTPEQKAVMNPYLEVMAAKSEAGLGLKTIVAGQKAVPLFREVNFVQREPVGEVLIGREMSEATIGKVFSNRATYGNDLVSGGSTTIRANLGDAFFDYKIIGDIDGWTKANRVAELQASEIAIIKADQPLVVQSRSPGLQEGFPVAKVEIGKGGKTITEIHAFEAFPAVIKAENVGSLKAVGGAEVKGPTTGFFGGIRKSSASFDKQVLRQSPGELPDIPLNTGNNPNSPYSDIKHAVGTSAVAKEAASLFYGRDAEITGMKSSFTKGQIMENYANAMDELLASQKGGAQTVVEKYQGSIRTNPLELPETKIAKAKAGIQEGVYKPQVAGVDIPMVKSTRVSEYPSSSYKTDITSKEYPSMVASASIIAAASMVGANESAYENIAPQTRTINSTYPSAPSIGAVMSSSPTQPDTYPSDYPSKTLSEYPTSAYPVSTPPTYPTGGYPPSTPPTHPTGGYPPSTPPPTPPTYPTGGYPPSTPPTYPTGGYPPSTPPTYPPVYPPTPPTLPPSIPPTYPFIKKKEEKQKGKTKFRQQKGKRFVEIFSFDTFKGMQVPERAYVKNYRTVGKRFAETFSLDMVNPVTGKQLPTKSHTKTIKRTKTQKRTTALKKSKRGFIP